MPGGWKEYDENTTIQVQSNTVITREFFGYDLAWYENGTQASTAWIEEISDSIGAHQHRGSPAATIGQIYYQCKINYLTDIWEGYQVVFEVDENGILKTCGYWLDACTGDCFEGFRIESIVAN